MPTTYTPTPALPSGITLPSDGDPKNVSSINPTFESLANWIAYLSQRSIETDGGGLTIPLYAPFLNTSSRFSGFGRGWQQVSVADGGSLCFFMPTYLECRLTQVELFIDGGGAPHSALPENKPRLTVSKLNMQTGVMTALGNVVDAAGSVVAYEQPHGLQLTGLTHDFNTVGTIYDQLVLEINGEFGEDSVANALMIYGAKIQVTPA